MILGAWDLKEFRTFCLDSGLDKALLYTESLAFKWNAAKYHKVNIQQKMKELKPSGNKALSLEYEIAFELDSLMLNLNSMWDILGQLINECFIRPKIEEERVYFELILNNNVGKNHQNSMPKNLLKDIQGNMHYDTIRAWANVSKHRHRITGELNVDMRETPTQVSYVTTLFVYKGIWYTLSLDDAIDCWEFVKRIGKSIDQIGAEIYESMKLKHAP